MKFEKRTKLSSDIPTASMPDIIFMLLIFFMVTTVLREFSGLPVNLPQAVRIEKLASKNHTTHVWVSKETNYLILTIFDIYYMKDAQQILSL